MFSGKIPRFFSSLSFPRCVIPVLLWSVFLNGLSGAPLHVDGTWDLDQDGASEILLFDQSAAPQLSLVEINPDGHHLPVWQFTVPEDWLGWITDAQLADVDADGTPELLATFLSLDPTLDGSPSWLLLFRWNGTAFDDPVPVLEDTPEPLAMRPVGFTYFRTQDRFTLAVIQSAPERKVLLMILTLDQGEPRVIPVYPLEPELTANGVNPLQARPLNQQGTTRLAIFSLEPPRFLLSLYDLTTLTAPVLTVQLDIQPPTRLLRNEVLVRDSNGDGYDDLILPLENDRVFQLYVYPDSVHLEETAFSNSGLFALASASADTVITHNFIRRIEAGLYESLNLLPEAAAAPFSPEIRPVYVDSLAQQLVYPDTLEPGDTLRYAVLDSLPGQFHQFRWLDIPPPGTLFVPDSFRLEWVADSTTTGPVTFSYQVDMKIGERLIESEDLMGPTHLVAPITTAHHFQLHAFVKPPVVWFPPEEAAPEDTVSGPPEPYRILVLTPKPAEEKRYLFDGIPPFSVLVKEMPVEGSMVTLLGHQIAADLSAVQRDKQVSFSYARTDTPHSQVQTLTIIHDLEANVLTLSLEPPLDTVMQSYQPELVNPDLYDFPNYFFQGFPASFTPDSLAHALQFPFTDTSAVTGSTSTITLESPSSPAHTLRILFTGGELVAIRGEVRVRENGMKKTITDIEVTPAFQPVLIQASVKKPVTAPGPTPADTLAAPVEPEPVQPPVPEEESLPDTVIQSLLEFPLPAPETFLKRWEPGFFLPLNRLPSKV
ncbi:MAG: VCBS repeat-containing protein [Candidatus Neomarinimicrobiota bacterium]|nr:MAG: VCBS repeat-containing protein [Candidatus Neomarinimicrobiota bacterium]